MGGKITNVDKLSINIINSSIILQKYQRKEVSLMDTKTIQVYSEKEGRMVDVEVINKEADSRFANRISVMLVVDEEE
ncbi:hypothetical protein PL321_11205 [Caloramator sp. mosi_1]|uniref:hypothetical protein n=1 Tax=Caloramator sp. mosi_1 TaxID=3023090 RepID=UPI002360486C|nr:hypothetical protein [Caloramator sp. mosi_1]WDC83333.1 hypothetical protein PL321_11205 [Caloramator sp. mosi_1]